MMGHDDLSYIPLKKLMDLLERLTMLLHFEVVTARFDELR